MRRTTTVYLASVLLLVANDHILKHLWPSALTGKLSDFAGLFALGLFFGTFLPRAVACAIAAGFFIWWKSPLSQAFIDSLPWSATRVIDWTDLLALIALIAAFCVLPRSPQRLQMRIGVSILSLFAFAATSVPHANVNVVPTDPLGTISTCDTREEVLSSFKACGFQTYSRNGSVLQLSMRIFTQGENRHTFAYVTVATDGTISLTGMQVFGRQPVDERAAEIAVHGQLVACASKCQPQLMPRPAPPNSP